MFDHRSLRVITAALTLALNITVTQAAALGAEEREPTGVYCKLQGKELQERKAEIRAELIPAVVDVDELDDGFRLWFSKSEARLRSLADFVSIESACCPFASYEIHVARGSSKVALSLRGPNGTKDIFRPIFEAAAENVDDR